jgi:hypothetical protein
MQCGAADRSGKFPITSLFDHYSVTMCEGRIIPVQSGDVANLVNREIGRISDSRIAARIRELAVIPYPVERPWDCGAPGEGYTCWTVLEHPESNTGIAFCAHGFGPTNPWGLVFLSGPHTNIGMDSAWFASLEDAFRESMAWDEPPPEGFELQ